MKRNVARIIRGAAPLGVLILALSACATAPRIMQGSPNYLAKGIVSEKLKGQSFYMAIGQADLYRHKTFGGVAPTGQAVDIAAAIQVDPASGQVQRILTLQPRDQDLTVIEPVRYQYDSSVSVSGGYMTGDLIGGLSVTDIHSYSTWLDTLDAMRKAVDDLRGYEPFFATTSQSTTTVVVGPPVLSWGWFWPNHPHPYPFHRR